MRAGIRTALVNTNIFKGVYDMQVPTAKTEKPFCVIKQSSDTKADDWIGYRRNYEIYPYVARGSFTDLDAKVNSVISALDRVLLTDSTETFTTFYTGCGQDYVDEEFDINTYNSLSENDKQNYLNQYDVINHLQNKVYNSGLHYQKELPTPYLWPRQQRRDEGYK